MHPEHIQRAVSAAAGGSVVVVFGTTYERVREIAGEFKEAIPGELVERVSRLNGDAWIGFYGGGKIRFRSIHPNARGGVRGVSMDRALVPIGTSPDVLADIIPALATSSEGIITGY